MSLPNKEILMKTEVGLWIDHREAIVVTINKNAAELRRVLSNVERQLQRSGDSPLKGPYEAQEVPADSAQQRAFSEHLNVYYDALIASIRDADSIFIFGPGEAKIELKSRLEMHHLDGKITAIETMDKMTDGQIEMKVKEHFSA
jgi:hypothetical protein